MNVVGWSAYTETAGLQKYFVSWTKAAATDKFDLLIYHFGQVFPSSVAVSSVGCGSYFHFVIWSSYQP